LLGRVEFLEAALKSARAEHMAATERAGYAEARSGAIGRERDTYHDEKSRLEDELRKREARLADRDDRLRQSENEKVEAEGRTSNIAAQLAASDAHGARLALDLAAAKERIGQLATLHQTARGATDTVTAELESLRQKAEAERQRAEQAEAAERLHVANAVSELHKLGVEFESERKKLGAATAALDETRAERDRLQGELAKLASVPLAPAVQDGSGKANPISAEEQAARRALVGMIERLADDIAHVSGAEPLPPVSPERTSEVAPAAAAE
jgi:chromosome segregation ATPase